jgi:hypothetical protein
VTRRLLCLHGHFYQPPRENPWIEAIEVQDSAEPFHDWNERIAAECDAPNAAARVKSAEDRIIDIVGNYDHLSFNVGPTLLAWLERERPDVHARVIEADLAERRAARARNALAQGYNHAIPARVRARSAHPDPLGHRRLPAPLRPRAGGLLAARDRGGHAHARGARAGGSATRCCRPTRRAA